MGDQVPLFPKMIGLVPLFLKGDFQNVHVPCSPKLVFSIVPLEYLPIFPCFLKINGLVPLFPKAPRRASDKSA